MPAVYKKDGKYLRYDVYTTHTGTHRKTEWVDNLQRATVFYVPPPQQAGAQDAEKIQATETRIVTLEKAPELNEKDHIRDLAVSCGFTLRQQPNGELDLNPYVYEFASKLVKGCATPASQPDPPHEGCNIPSCS